MEWWCHKSVLTYDKFVVYVPWTLITRPVNSALVYPQISIPFVQIAEVSIAHCRAPAMNVSTLSSKDLNKEDLLGVPYAASIAGLKDFLPDLI